MRALIVTNMYPNREHPALGVFVRDQVDALRRIEDITVEVFAFAPGSPSAYLQAGARLRARYRHDRFDIVHAHFGLTAWPALAARAGARAVTLHGTDLGHPRSRPITLAALSAYDLVATVSAPLARQVPGWATRKRAVTVLPTGVDLTRFRPIARSEARAALALDPHRPYLLFPADPGRPEKRYGEARRIAGDTPLLTLGGVDPREVPLWINAANAVLVTSEREGFGLAVLEALACDVPVLATPVGIAPEVLSGVPGTHCGPIDDHRGWGEALKPHLSAADPRIHGRRAAERFSADRMAQAVARAWRRISRRDPKLDPA